MVGEWSNDEEVRTKVETYRREVLDQAVGGMNKLAPGWWSSLPSSPGQPSQKRSV